MSNFQQKRLAEAETREEDAKKIYDEACAAANKIRQEIKNEQMVKLEKARAEVRKLEQEAGINPTSYDARKSVQPRKESVRIYQCPRHTWVTSTEEYHECPNCEQFCE